MSDSGPASARDRRVDVAIVDTGLELGEARLSDCEAIRRDFTGEGPHDEIGHGTAHAAIVGTGALGVVLASLKVVGRDDRADQGAVVAALAWARRHRARVISIGLGTYRPTSDLVAAIARTVGSSIVIAPVGNDARAREGLPMHPARQEGVLAAALRGSVPIGVADVLVDEPEPWDVFAGFRGLPLHGSSLATALVARAIVMGWSERVVGPTSLVRRPSRVGPHGSG